MNNYKLFLYVEIKYYNMTKMGVFEVANIT